MSHNVDLRVRRTRKIVRAAFVELLLEEGFESMTVQKLAERAMINRATFYRHYVDKFDLAQQIYTGLFDEYTAAMRARTSKTTRIDDPTGAWRLLFEHIGQYADIYLALLSGLPRFREIVRENIEQQTRVALLQMGLDQAQVALPLPLILRYLATAQMGIVEWWLETGRPLSPQEMAQHLMHLHTRGGMAALNLPGGNAD